jgi:cytochrome P450
VNANPHGLPGPRGLPWLGVTFELVRNPLALFERMGREYGDVSELRYWRGSRVLLNAPELTEQVLVVHHQKFTKGILLRLTAERLLGQGLLTSEGDLWRRQRRLAQPAFQRARIVDYAPAMVHFAQEQAAEWRPGERCDIAVEMMHISLRVAVRTLFGLELKSEARAVGQALTAIMRRDLRRMRSPFKLPPTFPTPANRRAEQGYDLLEGMVGRIIEEKRRDGCRSDDLLSRLIEAADEQGAHMSARQLRDETMTLLLAGHETTALALTWTWYLLSQNPAAEARLHEEIDRTLSGRLPTPDDLDRMPYLNAVIQESLRLYPPAYTIGRSSTMPMRLGGYDFPKETIFLMPTWVTQRDPRYFEDPLAFRPERWLDGLTPEGLGFRYFPFGGGPRRCIGQSFALMEAGLVIATLASRFRFRLAPGHPVVPEPLVTLRPKYGIPMVVEERR